jgi:hypothetical protein
MPEALKIVTISRRKDPDSRRYPARADVLSNAVCTDVNADHHHPEDTLEEPRMTVTVVVAKSSAKAGLIAGMLPFVHTFTVGAVSFSAVEFSNIFVT